MRRRLRRLRCAWLYHPLTVRRSEVHDPGVIPFEVSGILSVEHVTEAWYTCPCGQERGASVWQQSSFDQVVGKLLYRNVLDWAQRSPDVWRNVKEPTVKEPTDG
jgi:hypothetical protein